VAGERTKKSSRDGLRSPEAAGAAGEREKLQSLHLVRVGDLDLPSVVLEHVIVYEARDRSLIPGGGMDRVGCITSIMRPEP
jgi:hypothetical protein